MLDVYGGEFAALAPFDQLVEIMRALRGPGGCPWDREQTHQTLKRYLIEETFEAIDAIDLQDDEELQSELGDLLLQIVFHAQLASEENRFTSDDVCRSIVEKMIRRHPHVFGDGKNLENGQQVLVQWEEIKKRERAEKGEEPRRSRLDGIPRSLPALSFAEKLQSKAAKVNFVFDDAAGAWAKVDEELAELRANPSPEEFGDVLFACVALARQLGIDGEAALRSTNQKFRQRFQFIEEQLGERLDQQKVEKSELLGLWQSAKDSETANSRTH